MAENLVLSKYEKVVIGSTVVLRSCVSCDKVTVKVVSEVMGKNDVLVFSKIGKELLGKKNGEMVSFSFNDLYTRYIIIDIR